MVAYYKHRIPEWMDGTEGLDDAEYRVYHVVCQLIYLNEGPISNHEVGIAGRCNMHPLKFRAVLGRLIFKKKLVMVGTWGAPVVLGPVKNEYDELYD